MGDGGGRCRPWHRCAMTRFAKSLIRRHANALLALHSSSLSCSVHACLRTAHVQSLACRWPLARSFAHSLSRLACALPFILARIAQTCARSVVRPLVRSFVLSFVRSLVCTFARCSLVRSLTRIPDCSHGRSLARSLVRSPFARSLLRSLVRSFARSLRIDRARWAVCKGRGWERGSARCRRRLCARRHG